MFSHNQNFFHEVTFFGNFDLGEFFPEATFDFRQSIQQFRELKVTEKQFC